MMSSKQAEDSIVTTSEIFSTGASQINYKKQWNRFDDQTVALTFEVGASNLTPFIVWNDISIADLEEEDSTRADTPRLAIIEQQFKKYQNEHYRRLGAPFKEKLLKVRQREDDWDGKDSKKPNRSALDRAYTVLDTFLSAVIDSGRIWRTPFISSDEDGYITVEWKSGKHELHLEFSQETEEYIKIWGTNIEHDMHLGILAPDGYVNLWDWLNDD